MTDLFSTAANADRCAALLLQDRFRSGETITRALLNAAMTEAYGGSDAQGRWTQRESFEVLEHALALHLRTRPYELQALADVRAPIRLMANLPTQTVRSEEQLEWQQFSTPADIAALAVLLANAQPGDVVLEPSAGNGLLVAQLRQDVTLQLNELDPARRSRLAHSFPGAQISGHDGAAITSLMAASERPTLVLMNPPFSRSLGRGADDLAQMREEGDDVVLGRALDLVDAVRIERRGAALFPDDLRRFLRHDAEFRQGRRRVRLDLEPDAESRLRRPDIGHFGSGIARDHWLLFQARMVVAASRMAAMRAA